MGNTGRRPGAISRTNIAQWFRDGEVNNLPRLYKGSEVMAVQQKKNKPALAIIRVTALLSRGFLVRRASDSLDPLSRFSYSSIMGFS